MEHHGSRRDAIKLAAALPVAGVAASLTSTSSAAGHEDNEVATAFEAMVNALTTGNLEAFYGAMHDDFVMIDEDSPFRHSKEEFEDHIAFHVGGVWDSFQWLPVNTRATVFGRSGTVVGTATFRGKPKDAGFRIRHLLIAQTWTKTESGDWKLLLWHQSPMYGHIDGASPG